MINDACYYQNKFNNVAQLLEDGFSCFSEKPAFHSLGQSLSFAEIEQKSRYLAQWFQHQCGLKAGDRIAIQLPNLTQYPIVTYAAFRAGLVIVNTNPLYTSREMKHQFNDSGARVLVILEDLMPKYQAIKDELCIEKVLITAAPDLLTGKQQDRGDYFDFNSVINEGSHLPPVSKNDAQINDIAVIQYTGGTTGISKGACLTHRNLMANASQMNIRISQKTESEGENFVCPLPLYHIYAFTVNLISLFSLGVQNILIPNPRDIDGFVQTLKDVRFSGFSGINTLFMGLCQHPEFPSLDFSQLKITFSGGSMLTSKAYNTWFEITGCTITEGWGLSETSPVITLNEFNKEQVGCVGTPLHATEVQVWDINNQPLAQGQIGELVVKGPQVMLEYWQRPDETANSIINGFFKTGDVGLIKDDGHIQIVDRLKDMIIVSGFNVYPNEVEDILCSHQHITEAAVVGDHDEKAGEIVHAHIATLEPLDEGDIIHFCRQHLTNYKVPKRITFHQQLPKSAVGKVLRRELRNTQ
ncbi:AMP-binding protein [Vibrio ziniensis]|uniref:Long-chain-fatty-acid--CoA ligase n=1 Tax=Vibrio ziniensis TaxID=2711221 RepID=A0A6G7CEG1_9VIBR|nr:AMP-binding protein [Vibrio ziniensis]QIH40472.1 AMP-binding protein [Vibrio ziniensis]